MKELPLTEKELNKIKQGALKKMQSSKVYQLSEHDELSAGKALPVDLQEFQQLANQHPDALIRQSGSTTAEMSLKDLSEAMEIYTSGNNAKVGSFEYARKQFLLVELQRSIGFEVDSQIWSEAKSIKRALPQTHVNETIKFLQRKSFNYGYFIPRKNIEPVVPEGESGVIILPIAHNEKYDDSFTNSLLLKYIRNAALKDPTPHRKLSGLIYMLKSDSIPNEILQHFETDFIKTSTIKETAALFAMVFAGRWEELSLVKEFENQEQTKEESDTALFQSIEEAKRACQALEN